VCQSPGGAVFSMAPSHLEKAFERIDEIHAEDPVQDRDEDQEVPRELLYARRLSTWVERLNPKASEALRLAARCQHLKRWAIPRKDYPMGRAGYYQWKTAQARAHADLASQILQEVGYDQATIDRVAALVRKENLRSDVDTQTLEDAACLVFLESEFAQFLKKHPEEKIVDIVKKTWAKMSPAAQDEALDIPLPKDARKLVEKALG
ncbi:MAG: DUF4202 domain-containing protein, partial [Bdellovibrionota bacterium]